MRSSVPAPQTSVSARPDTTNRGLRRLASQMGRDALDRVRRVPRRMAARQQIRGEIPGFHAVARYCVPQGAFRAQAQLARAVRRAHNRIDRGSRGQSGSHDAQDGSEREVMNLVYYQDKSIEEVAAIVALRQTLKTRMFYVRRQMAELLVQRAWMDFGCAARNSSDTYS